MAVGPDGARHAAAAAPGARLTAIAAIRSFVAILLPPEIQARLGARIEGLRPLARRVSWVVPANLHLTLKFLGDVEEARTEAIAAALAGAAARMPAFEVVVRGLGAFPSAARPRVIWAGVTSDGGSLPSLARAVEEVLAAAGFPADPRGFSGHVTLGRIRVPRRDAALGQVLAGAEGEVFGAFRVERISLMRSEPLPGGSRYTELAGLPLAPPGPRQS